MAKRKHEDGDGAGTTADVAPKREKKNRVKEQELPAMAIVKREPGEAPPSSEYRTKEVPVAVDASQDDQGKKKKKKNKVQEAPVTVDALQVVEDDQGKKKKKKLKEVPFTVDVVEDDQGKKKKNKTKEVVLVDASHVVEDDSHIVEDGSHVVEDDQGKKKKKKKMKTEEVSVTVDASQVVEDVPGKKRKEVAPTPVIPDDQGKEKNKKKTKEAPVTVDASQVVEDDQGKKKQKKTKEVEPTPVIEDGQGKKKKTKKDVSTPDASQVVEDDQGKKKKKKTRETEPTPVIEDGQGKKKKTKKDVSTPDASQIVEDGQGKGKEVVTLEVPQDGQRKKKNKRKDTSQDPFHGTGPVKKEVVTVEDVADGQGKKKKRKVDPSSHGTRSVKKTILKSQSSIDAELDKNKTKKQVTFQLPDRVEDRIEDRVEDRVENVEFFGEEGEHDFLGDITWAEDRLRSGLVYGAYTPEEDRALKKAIFDYIQEQGWDREAGLEKVLNSKSSGAKGCWFAIRKCLPMRELKRLHSRAHRLLGPNTYLGKWSDEESNALMELHSLHGNNWKTIAKVVGRTPEACCDKWRHQLKYTKSLDYKTGPWSEDEHQKLCQLVLKCIHVKEQMKKMGIYTKTHKVLRDDVNWDFVAEQMGGRTSADCLRQWYRIMASPMVPTGEWSNHDDQRLLERLMEEFPLSEELVEWDSLLENRSGETCKRRWEQMQRTLGRAPQVRHQHFLEKLESIMKRFAPHLLDPEYDQKFADDMQRVDDEKESEDADKSDDDADV